MHRSHEYVVLLLQAIEETAADVRKDLSRPQRAAAVRRRQGFQLVAYSISSAATWPPATAC